MTKIRAKTIYAALEAFEPDVLIVDKEPLGANRELKLTLDKLREHGYTRFVLGLRDVLDDPVFVNERNHCESCSSKEDDIRHYYDAIWIYGDPTVYDIQRFGIDFVASPRHADMLLVTGPVSRQMELALKKTYLAMPEPKLVITCGDCAINGGVYKGSYATRDGIGNVIPVDYRIHGCPPTPTTIIKELLKLMGNFRN